MAFDLQSLLGALGLGGGATTPPGNAQTMQSLLNAGGGMLGAAQSGGAPTTPQPVAGGGLAGLFGLSPNALGGLGSTGGVGASGLGGPLSLLGAGASMLNSSDSGKGLGSILGSGVGGFVQGGQLDRSNSLQQQQQSALQRLAEQILNMPSGNAQSATPPTAPQTPPMGGGVTPAMAPPVINAPRPTPQVPGAPPAPGPQGGGQPLGGGQQQPNPFIQKMLQQRYGRMI